MFCSHILILVIFYSLLLSSFSFDFLYFPVFLVQLICFSFVIHWFRCLPFVLFKNDNSAYRLWGPPACSMGTWGAFTGGDVKLTTHLHLVALHLYSSIAFMPCIVTTALCRSLSRLLCLRFVPIHILYFLSFLFLELLFQEFHLLIFCFLCIYFPL